MNETDPMNEKQILNEKLHGGEALRSEAPPFYHRPEAVWSAFCAWWEARWPDRPRPQFHNLQALTGLPADFLRGKL